MIISLSPVRMDERLTLDREGDVLYVNGEAFDFAPLSEGATLPWGAVLSGWFPGEVHRINGELHLTVRLPVGPDAPYGTRFPEPIVLAEDGPVELPIYTIEPEFVEPPPLLLEAPITEGEVLPETLLLDAPDADFDDELNAGGV